MLKNNKNRLIVAAIAVVLIGVGWFVWSVWVSVTTYAKTTSIDGNYTVAAKHRAVLEKGAALSIKGNLTLNGGEMTCKDGPLQILVSGDLNVTGGKLTCKGDNGSIAIVAMGSVNIDKDSVITADGPVQIAASKNDIATSITDLDRLYASAATADGGKNRLGPLLDSGALPENSPAPASASKGYFLALQDGGAAVVRGTDAVLPVAHAAGEAVVNIGGKIVIPNPPKDDKRPIVVFNFPGVQNVNIQNLDLQGPDGRAGADDINKSCSANGRDGDNAFRFLARAGSLKVGDFTLTLGSGGKGGDAETKTDCYPNASAKGGKGGKSGNFKMVAENDFEITGTFTINAGRGGDGGKATATGKDGGVSENGAAAAATGGIGSDNMKTLGLKGTVKGLSNVQVGSLLGGKGGDAKATPGKGGNGDACGKKGGDGGKATATGGRGGEVKTTLTPGAVRAAGADDEGGKGGDASAMAAAGGTGGNCEAKAAGGNGGKGGDAKATAGKGGNAPKKGADGAKVSEQGGNGGNGGDGCKAGKGGKGGNGETKGADGQDGKDLCVVPGKPNAQMMPGSNNSSNGSQEVEVISYKGKYIPVSELMIEEHSGCDGAAHWHSKPYSGGPVKATDGSTVVDPGPDCGFGKVSQVPKMKVQVPK